PRAQSREHGVIGIIRWKNLSPLKGLIFPSTEIHGLRPRLHSGAAPRLHPRQAVLSVRGSVVKFESAAQAPPRSRSAAASKPDCVVAPNPIKIGQRAPYCFWLCKNSSKLSAVGVSNFCRR